MEIGRADTVFNHIFFSVSARPFKDSKMAKGQYRHNKESAGNPGKRSIPVDVMDEHGIGDAPTVFLSEEKIIWESIKAACPWLQWSDREAVKMLCENIYDVKLARRSLRDRLLQSDDDESRDESARMRTMFAIMDKGQDRIYKILSAIGMTPKSRQSIPAEKPSNIDPDIEKLFS